MNIDKILNLNKAIKDLEQAYFYNTGPEIVNYNVDKINCNDRLQINSFYAYDLAKELNIAIEPVIKKYINIFKTKMVMEAKNPKLNIDKIISLSLSLWSLETAKFYHIGNKVVKFESQLVDNDNDKRTIRVSSIPLENFANSLRAELNDVIIPVLKKWINKFELELKREVNKKETKNG